TVIWLWWLRNHPTETQAPYYWAYGFLLTGGTLLVIGFFLGRIGRAARHAELPPPEVTQAAKAADLNVAARAPVMVPMNPAAPAGMPAVMPTAQVPPAVPVPPTPPVAQPASPSRD